MGGNAKLKGKFWKRLGKPVLALALALCVAQGTGGSAIAATLTELQQKQARLEQEKKENDAKLAELKADQSKQQEYKDALDAQMQNLQSQIDGLNTQINDLDASISEKNAAIAEKQENIDRDVETLKDRLCAIYMMGDASTLEIILQSESVIDMAQKVELLNMITEHDTKMIQQLSADMEAIADEKAEIESQKEEVAAARTERAPLWHGTAFLVEALVLLAFLTAALAVFAQLFASARTEAARGAELSEAVAIAQNAAERFAAAADPAALDGATTATGPQTGNAYYLVIDVEPTEQAAGTLWTATIYVDRTPAAASGAAGGQDESTAADSQAAASTASPAAASGQDGSGRASDQDVAGAASSTDASAAQTESLTIYTLTTARYVPEGEVA